MSLARRIAPYVITAFTMGAGILAGPSVAYAKGKAATAATKAGSAENPSRVRVASPSEPGTPLVLHVRIADAVTGRPIRGAKRFVYQTDDAGYYDRGNDGRERGPRGSRVHAPAHSDSTGLVVFDTIVPGSFPGSGIFRHIHYALSAVGYDASNQEFILDEAPRPSEEQKRWAARNGDPVVRREKGKDGRSEIRATLKLQPAKEG